MIVYFNNKRKLITRCAFRKLLSSANLSEINNLLESLILLSTMGKHNRNIHSDIEHNLIIHKQKNAYLHS